MMSAFRPEGSGLCRARGNMEGVLMDRRTGQWCATVRWRANDSRLLFVGRHLRLLGLPPDRGQFDELLEKLADVPGTSPRASSADAGETGAIGRAVEHAGASRRRAYLVARG